MKLKITNHLKGILLINLVICLAACKKMDATYAKYIKDGEIVYVSKPDSVKAYPGKNRILLTWPIGVDPKVSKARVFWNGREDSTEYNIDRGLGIDTAKVWLNDMSEGSYSFDVITYDNKGHSSVKVNVQSNVYGENYNSSIVNRKVKTAVYKNSAAVIDWYNGVTDAIAVEVSYTDNQGAVQKVLVSTAEKQTTLPNYKNASEISFRTLFLPEVSALDTFYTASSSIIPEHPLEELVKSKFTRWNPAGFPYTEYNQGTNAFNIERLWDNVYTGYGFMFNETKPLPSSFTFNMGQLAKLKHLRLSPNWDSQLYKNGNVKKFQLWGSATPNVTIDFSTWVFLGEFNSYKPSALPLGQTTSADLDYAKAGETFDIVENDLAVQYIRIVVQETWNPANFKTMHITELTFLGYIQ